MLAQAGEPENVPEIEPEPVDPSLEVNDSSVVKTANRAYEQALAAALRQPIPELGALPVAQHRFLFDTDKKAPQHCVCAELIHLQADKDNARLLPMQSLNVSKEESDQLIKALNGLIHDDGLEVFSTTANEFYLSGMPASELDTWPAHAVANGKIANYLPRKSAAGDWRRLMTEVQMLFHTHPVNIARIDAQQLPINGMWFWGGAKALAHAPIDTITLFATDAYSCGLATSMKMEVKNPNEFDWSDLSNDLVIVELGVYDAWLRSDHTALQNAKQRLQEQWILPAQKAVADGLCSAFVLDGCEGQAIVEKPKPTVRAAFWNRFSIRKWFGQRNGSASGTNEPENNSDSSA